MYLKNLGHWYILEQKAEESMKPTYLTPNTLILGCHAADGTVAVLGTLRTLDCELVTGVLRLAGPLWATLGSALDEAATMDVDAVLVLTDVPALVKSLSRPFNADLASDDYWALLRRIGMAWAGRFRCEYVAKLPAATEFWAEEFGKVKV